MSNVWVNYVWVTHISLPPPAGDRFLWVKQTLWGDGRRTLSNFVSRLCCSVLYFLCCAAFWAWSTESAPSDSLWWISDRRVSQQNDWVAPTSCACLILCKLDSLSTANNVDSVKWCTELCFFITKRFALWPSAWMDVTCRQRSCDIPALHVLTPFSLLFLLSRQVR